MVDSISFFCAGTPEPKGSTRAFVVKGHAVTTSSNRNLKQWELRIAHEAQSEAAKVGWTFGPDEAYGLSAAFYFAEPKGHAKKWWYQNTKRPDLDKLLRAVLDGLTNVLFLDDAQVTDFNDISKSYSAPDAGILPGAEIEVVRRPRKVLR
jgi:Holliday junction resolvase RusA-like endonuclease